MPIPVVSTSNPLSSAVDVFLNAHTIVCKECNRETTDYAKYTRHRCLPCYRSLQNNRLKRTYHEKLKTKTCKLCDNKVGFKKQYCEAHKDWYRNYGKQTRLQNKLNAVALLGGVCVDCGIKSDHPEIYDFHHVDPTKKDDIISHMLLYPFETLKVELFKCVLLCSNCHRIRHNKEED